MTAQLIQYAFAAGEISPTLLGRTDLEKYDLGLSLARNWYVDYRGGLTTRPGTKFIDYLKDDDKNIVLHSFRYAPDTANTYALVFGHQYIRFVQEGAYVLEDSKVVTSVTAASPGVVTSTAHGFATGDWVKMAGRTFEVGATTANTFALKDPFGNNFSTVGQTAVLAATSVARIYTVASPYDADDLPTLKVKQHLNEVYLTHKRYQPRKMTRNDHTDWDLELVLFSNSVARPTGLTITSSIDEDYALTAAVTAKDADGNESLPFYAAAKDLTQFGDTSNRITFTWAAAAGAVEYNVYRSRLMPNGAFTSGQQVGFLGRTKSLTFIDDNIIPDFTSTPPRGYNPFSPGAIEQITITAPGSGYTVATTVSITDPDGSGFLGFPVIGVSGTIEGVIILNGGTGYTAPTVVFTDGTGTGATATADATPILRDYPALFSVFQQRGVYAATDAAPITLWGSRPGNFGDFSYSDIVVEDDSYTFTLDAEEVSPIRHMVAQRGGLLLMTQGGIWLLTGGNETAVSAINALADPQTYNGVSAVEPLLLGPDILYVEGKGSTVKLLSYNDFSKVYGGISMSLLANHLFSTSKQIVDWAYAESPGSVVWAARSDGALLAFTYDNTQKVYAWTQNWTKGKFLRAEAVQEGIEDVTYLIVERKINGRTSKYLESLAPREVEEAEDAWCVDSGLALSHTYPNASVALSGHTGTITVTASSAVFSAGDVGKVFRGGGGRGTVTAFTDSTHITVLLDRDITDLVPEDATSAVQDQAALTWALDTPVSAIGGLWHLEGETVAILADGNVQSTKTVTNGSITLDEAASTVVIGLPYTCIARNLPLTAQDAIIEEKRKRMVGLGIRLHDTRGLKYGIDLDSLYDFKEWRGAGGELLRDHKYGLLRGRFEVDAQIYLVQEYPLPATVLGLVLDFEVGDDPS